MIIKMPRSICIRQLFIDLNIKVFLQTTNIFYGGLRIPIVSKLNIQQWRSDLSDYHDNVIVDYLEFGWPVGYHY